MDRLLYCLALGLVKFFQALPLRAVARLGRAGGGLAYWIDARHRRVAIENLTRCFGQERPPIEIRALARENFKRLGENYCCAIKTAGMSWAELQKHLEFDGLEKLDVAGDREENPSADRRGMKPANTSESSPSPPLEEKARGEEAVFSGPTVHLQRQSPDASDSSGSASCVIAIGHFGNFEVYSRANQALPQFQFASTYRALKQPALNKLLFDLRTRSGCLLFERRRESEALRLAMSSQRLLLGLFSDQHAGVGGAWIPFFGQFCSTTAAPAVFASRYKAPLHTAICYRIALARWRFEVGDAIPTRQDGQRRSPEDIMLDVNRAFEAAIRRDPANWFWVHKRWKRNQSEANSPSSKVAEPVPQAGNGA